MIGVFVQYHRLKLLCGADPPGDRALVYSANYFDALLSQIQNARICNYHYSISEMGMQGLFL